ncbi:MAG: serine hydrolase [Oscillospiraceae bacterium]|nr:serine hydrolase [Oscillospiraceae bacterium]
MTQKMFKRVIAVLITATLALTPLMAMASAYEETVGEFPLTRQVAIETAAELMEALSVPGMTMAVVDIDSGFTWLQNFGYADVANQVPVTSYTLFNIGSTAKVFTTIAILQLVEEGILDLDEPIVTYLPEFSMLPHPVYGGDYRNITTRMLITHTSGAHEYSGDGFATPYAHDRTLMNRLMPLLTDLHMQNVEMNRMTYNNTAYALLGILVARLTGSENYFDGFVRYTQEHIFTPADMVSSSFEITPRNRPYVALPYDDATTLSEWVLYVGPTSAGGMVSNALDMAQFMRTMLSGGGELLSEESVRAMAEIQDLGIIYPTFGPGNMQMGLGLMSLPRPGGFVTTGHAGGLQHTTEMLLDFDNGFGVFVSSNSITGVAAVTHLALAALSTAVYEKTGAPPVPTVNLDDRNRFVPQDLQELVGWYTIAGELILTDDDTLLFPAFQVGLLPLELTHVGNGRFSTEIGVEVHFELIGELMFLFFGDEMLGERISVSPVSADFEKWVGVYHVLDADGNPIINPSTPESIVGINESGFAYFGQGGMMFLMDRVDGDMFHFPGRQRMFGSVGEFSMDGDVATFKYSDWVFVRADSEPAGVSEEPTVELRFTIGDTEYIHNGVRRQMDSAAFLDLAYGRTMIPLSAIAEIFGAQVNWNGATQTATITLGEVSVTLSTDVPLPSAMGRSHNISGRVFVPIAYVAHAFGFDVRWDSGNQVVDILG